MTSVSVDRIMNNIYGTTASQEMNSILITGGESIVQRPKAKINYVDYSSTEMFNGLSGGKKRKTQRKKYRKSDNSSEITIYASPEYIDNKLFTEFIKTFYLYFKVSRSPTSAIYVIPSQETMNHMNSEASKILAEKSVVAGSIEAQKLISTAKGLDFRRYLFTAFGNNTKDQKYRIDASGNNKDAYPNDRFDTVRRTNLNSEVYYISYDSPTTVNISSSEKGGETKKLKFVARASNGVYIFSGDLPKATEKSDIAKSAKRTTTMTGGGNIGKFASLCNNFGDIELAAEEFVLDAYNKNNDVLNDINGDPVYTAFKITFDEKEDVGDIMAGILSSSEKEKIKDDIVKKLNISNKLSNSILDKIEKSKDTFQRYLKSKKAKSNGYKDIINMYMSLYGNKSISKIKADLATSLYRNGMDNINDIMAICEEFQNPDFNSQLHKSGRFAKLLINAYQKTPLTSLEGSSYIPIFGSLNKKRKIKNNATEKSTDDEKDIMQDETEEVEIIDVDDEKDNFEIDAFE